MISQGSSGLVHRIFGSKMRLALLLAAVALLVFHFVPRTVAQNSAGSKAGAKMMNVNITQQARDIVLGDLPQVTAANPAPRPNLSGVRLPQNSSAFRTLQLQAGKRNMAIPSNSSTMDPPKSLLDLTAGTSGILPDTVFPPSAFYLPPTTVAASGGCYNFAPYGVAVAASPQYLVQMGANCITIINPATGTAYPGFPKSLNAFWGVGTNLVLEPRAIFDAGSNHFVLAAEDFTANLLLLATSVTANPTGTWHLYYLADFFNNTIENPTLGQSLQESGDKLGAIYLGHDSYNPSTFAYVTDWITVIGKSKTYAGTLYIPIQWFNFTDASGTQFNSIQPVNVVNAHDRPRAEVLVNTYGFDFNDFCITTTCNGVVLWSLNDQIPSKGRSPGAAGPIVVPTANNYELGGVAIQPAGSSCGPDVFYSDESIYSQVDYSSGSLYAAINTFNPVSFSSEILSWQIAPHLDDGVGNVTGGTIRSETVLAFSAAAALNPAIIPNSEGNYTMVYTYVDPSTPPTTAYLSNRVTQAPNTLSDAGVVFSPGSTPYCPTSSGGFAFINASSGGAATGVYPNSAWFSSIFSDATGNWATLLGKTGYTNPAQP